MAWIWAMFGIGALVTVGIAFATRDLSQAIKSGLASIFLTLAIADFTALINYAGDISAFGGLVGIVAFVIYIPLGVGFVVAVANWIGGSQ